MLSAPMLSVLVLAADGATGSGGADAGESSAWDAGGFAFWIGLIVIGLVVLLLGLVVNSRRRAPASGTVAATSGEPVPRRVEHVDPGAGWDLTILSFHHLDGAERAFAEVGRARGVGPWSHDVAFAELHRHGRILVRGTFAGHYLDVEDLTATTKETLLSAAVRASVPAGGSAVIAFAPRGDVEELVAVYGDRPAGVSRHLVSAQEAAILALTVSAAPAATASDMEKD